MCPKFQGFFHALMSQFRSSYTLGFKLKVRQDASSMSLSDFRARYSKIQKKTLNSWEQLEPRCKQYCQSPKNSLLKD